MRTDELDYDLPEAAIAQAPATPRDAARLLVPRPLGAPLDRTVRDLPELLAPGDLLVVNDTRVLPARVRLRRSGGGAAEVLLLEPVGDGWWSALCRPSRKLRHGDVVEAAGGELAMEFGEELGGGRRAVRPRSSDHSTVEGSRLIAALDRVGEVPLPPYVTGGIDDAGRYQTVYARRPASAAAPTAGLHLTTELIDRLAERGVGLADVELVVGLDTFRPIETELVEAHRIHSEWYQVPPATAEAVRSTRLAGGRVVAVGTTTVRALESAASGAPVGRTELFITPGFEFSAVDVLLTNFHLPRSSLLAMIEAFVGPVWRSWYATALERGYRFLSFGDAMLLERAGTDR